MSALIDCIETVLEMSMLGGLRSLGGYREVLNRVFTRVDFPRPDSPVVPLVRRWWLLDSVQTYQRP
jgi:hypothetical protein